MGIEQLQLPGVKPYVPESFVITDGRRPQINVQMSLELQEAIDLLKVCSSTRVKQQTNVLKQIEKAIEESLEVLYGALNF